MTAAFDPIGNERDRALVLERLEQFEKDNRFLDKHRQEWTELYPDCWVIVYEERLVSHGESLSEVLEAVIGQGIPSQNAARDFLPKEPVKLILTALG